MQLADHCCPRKARLPRPLPAAATNGHHDRATPCSSVKFQVVPSSTNTCPCYKPHPATVPDRCGAPPLPDDWNSIGDGRIRISVAPEVWLLIIHLTLFFRLVCLTYRLAVAPSHLGLLWLTHRYWYTTARIRFTHSVRRIVPPHGI